jgi:hypothetical protein
MSRLVYIQFGRGHSPAGCATKKFPGGSAAPPRERQKDKTTKQQNHQNFQTAFVMKNPVPKNQVSPSFSMRMRKELRCNLSDFFTAETQRAQRKILSLRSLRLCGGQNFW